MARGANRLGWHQGGYHQTKVFYRRGNAVKCPAMGAPPGGPIDIGTPICMGPPG